MPTSEQRRRIDPADFIDDDAGVYSLWCTESGRDYLAWTHSFRDVYIKHFQKLYDGDHHVQEMQRDFEEHGRHTFTFCIVERVDGGDEELRKRFEDYRSQTSPETLYNPETDDDEDEEENNIPVMERPDIDEETRQMILNQAGGSWRPDGIAEYLNRTRGADLTGDDVEYVLNNTDDTEEGSEEPEESGEEDTRTSDDTSSDEGLDPELQGLY